MDPQTITFEYESYAGKQLTRELNPIIDIREFKGTAGFPLLVLAAATKNGLSVAAVWHFLLKVSFTPGGKGAMRSHTYLQKRRWMFLPPGASNQRNRDGKDARAIQIMSEHPELSIRDLAVLLKQRGINRKREWIRMRRCDN